MMNVTRHARKRIKERCGVSKSAAERYAERALSAGVERKDTKGALRRWLDEKYNAYTSLNKEIWIYGEKVFIVSNQTLVTVMNLPNDLKRHACLQRRPS